MQDLTPARKQDLTPPVLRLREVRLGLWALAIGLGLAVVAVRAYLARAGALPGDRYIAERLPSPRIPQTVEQLADFFGALAYPLVAVMTVAVGMWVVWRLLGRRRALGVLLASTVVIVNGVLKQLFGPTQLFADAVAPSEAINYPSGHVAYATALFGFLGYLGLERRRPEVAVVARLLIAVMGPSRVLTGAHIPSDVLGGYLLGAAWLLGTILWTTRR